MFKLLTDPRYLRIGISENVDPWVDLVNPHHKDLLPNLFTTHVGKMSFMGKWILCVEVFKSWSLEVLIFPMWVRQCHKLTTHDWEWFIPGLMEVPNGKSIYTWIFRGSLILGNLHLSHYILFTPPIYCDLGTGLLLFYPHDSYFTNGTTSTGHLQPYGPSRVPRGWLAGRRTTTWMDDIWVNQLDGLTS